MNIEIIEDPKEYVYDFTIPTTENFMLSNGLFTHNTLNSIDWKDKIVYKICKKIVNKFLKEFKAQVEVLKNRILYKINKYHLIFT